MKHKGFTVVELLAVIVIIGILASITIVYFGSWRSRTATTEVKDSLTQLASALRNERNFTNYYPTAVPSNYTAGKNVTVTYSVNAARTNYCAKGVSKAVPSIVYYISDAKPSPTTTACSV